MRGTRALARIEAIALFEGRRIWLDRLLASGVSRKTIAVALDLGLAKVRVGWCGGVEIEWVGRVGLSEVGDG